MAVLQSKRKNRLCHKYRGYSTFSNYSGRNKGNKTKCYQKRYVFEGWYTTEDFQTGTVTVNKGTPITSDKIAALLVPVEKWVTSDGQDWNIETDNVTANMEIHPVWKLNDPEVNLSAEGNVTKVHTGNSVKLIAEA